MNEPFITIFTPTYNRVHTLERTYKSLCNQTCKDFEWIIIDDGSTDDTSQFVYYWIKNSSFTIKYIYKKNEGLYTCYNEVATHITTELCVCIDSDDYMPNNAIELINSFWRQNKSTKYAGIIGLDYFITGEPIGGRFPKNLNESHFIDLSIKGIHKGDTKLVIRTDLLKSVAPMNGFPNEKNFNPVYLILKIDNDYPFLILNENICYVEYQDTDSMSKNIYFQYLDSPRSFAELRRLEMTLKHNTFLNKCRVAVHYVASCIISKEKYWLKLSPLKLLTCILAPIGYLLYLYIKYKTKNR